MKSVVPDPISDLPAASSSSCFCREVDGCPSLWGSFLHGRDSSPRLSWFRGL